MKIARLAAIPLSLSWHVAAWAVPDCHSNMQRLTVDEQVECAKTAASLTSAARKMLEQRLVGFTDKLERATPMSAERQGMARLAMDAKEKLAELTVQDKAAGEAYEKLKTLSLQMRAGPRYPAAPPEGIRTALELAGAARKEMAASEAAESELTAAIGALAGLADPSRAATDDEKRAAIALLKATSDRAAAARAAADAARQAVIKHADKLVMASASQDILAGWQYPVELDKIITAQWKVQAEANNLIYRMNGPFPEPSTPSDETGTKKRDWDRARQLSYLAFLQRHPLLSSEVSGTGIQLKTTAGESAVTLKGALEWGSTASRQAALTLSAPINKKTEDKVWRVKNNAMLDELAGDFTAKLDLTDVSEWVSNDFADYKVIGFSLAAGWQKFAYFEPSAVAANPADPARSDAEHRSSGFAGYWGFAPKGSKSLVLLRYARQFEKKAKDSTVICPVPLAGANHTQCRTGIVGAPSSHRHGVISLEGRYAFKHLALAGTFSYDHINKVKGFTMPLHVPLFNRGFGSYGAVEPQFSAGVIVGWRSDANWSFGLFAGMPFSLFRAE